MNLKFITDDVIVLSRGAGTEDEFIDWGAD